MPRYQAELEALTGSEADGLLQMETNAIGGYANAMRIALVSAISEQEPEKGISQHFHYFIVSVVQGLQAGDSSRTMYPGDGPQQRIELPEVAENWPQLQALIARRRGAAPAIAIA